MDKKPHTIILLVKYFLHFDISSLWAKLLFEYRNINRLRNRFMEERKEL